MKALVTGAAGFIGSHLAERLCDDGWQVRGVDSLVPYYDTSLKQRNLNLLQETTNFEYANLDLSKDPLGGLVEDVDVVFHLAGQPGVRASWGDFGTYLRHNAQVTGRLLEAAKGRDLRRFVFASSSSIYGNVHRYPTAEGTTPNPTSPYGVTKLAAEHLCRVYATSFGVPTLVLRYFTVYGPRQRPDMAMNRLIASVFEGRPFPLYGDGKQIRDFTYVSDVIEANLKAALSDVSPGWTGNVAGGSPADMNRVIELVEQSTGESVQIQQGPPQAGDVARTGGSIAKIASDLEWSPRVGLDEGLRRQVEWQTNRLVSGRSLPGS